MAVTQAWPSEFRFVDANGDPVTVSGVALTTGIEIFEVGTSTQKNSYPTQADAEAATNANANPLAIADGLPASQVWVDGLYKSVVKYGSVTLTTDNRGDASDVNILPAAHIAGLTLSNGTDADHDIDIATGECRDAADSLDITVTSIITAAIDASGANGLDTGAVANTTLYAFWLIADSSGSNSVAGLFSTSFSNPTLPTGYDKKRLIGAVKTDGSANIIAFTQQGDYFRYTGDVILDVNDNTITDMTFEVGTLSAPPNSMAHIYGHGASSAGVQDYMVIHIRTNGAADGPDDGVWPEAWAAQESNGAAGRLIAGAGMVLVDGSSQIQYAMVEDSGTATVRISTFGFIMLTRREP